MPDWSRRTKVKPRRSKRVASDPERAATYGQIELIAVVKAVNLEETRTNNFYKRKHV